MTAAALVPDFSEPVMAAELTDSKVQSYEDQIAYIEAEMEKLQGTDQSVTAGSFKRDDKQAEYRQ